MITELSDRLALIVDAKTDGAVANIHKLSLEEKAAADRADVLRAKLADLEVRAAKQSATPSGVSRSTALQLGRTRQELAGLEANLAKVPQGAGVAEKALAKLGYQGTITGSALTKGLAGGAIAIAAFGEFEFLKKGIDGYTHLADQIRGVQQAAGGTTQDASRLVAITNALGLDSQVAALGVFRLGKNIELTPSKLAAYGIAIARTKQGNVDLIGTLANVADAYQKTQDPAKRAALVYEAFGRSGVSLLPILNANKDTLKQITEEAAKQGRIFNSGDLERARDYQIAIRELQESWQSLAISAGKDLVPALAAAAHGMSTVLDTFNKAHTVDFLIPFVGIAHLLGGHGSKNATAQAAQAVADEQTKQMQDALEKAAAATLGDSSSLLATPGQGLADAKQTLKDARQALADAVAARNRAAKDLAAVRTGAPGADATALEAAVARVHAAQARLRAAEYVGGDARVASAQASLLSAQDALNKLRASGGTETNKLATATERLHKANEAVAAAQRKEKEAQRAKNQATGFSVTDIQQKLAAQLKDKTALTGAEGKLANLGANTDLLAYLNTLNQQTPGTLVKTAKGATAALVSGLNDEFAQVNTQKDIFTSIAGNPDAWRTAGVDRATSFAAGWQSVLSGALPLYGPPSGRGPATGAPPSLGQLLSPQVNVNGPVTVQAQDPEAFGRKLAAKRRHGALSGLPTGASL